MTKALRLAMFQALWLSVAAMAAGCADGSPRAVVEGVTHKLFWGDSGDYKRCFDSEKPKSPRYSKLRRNSCSGGRYVLDDMIVEKAMKVDAASGRREITISLYPMGAYRDELHARCSHWNDPSACELGAELLLDHLASVFCNGVDLDKITGPVECVLDPEILKTL